MDFNTDNLKDMMETCKRFLEVGGFDTSNFKNYSKMSSRKFMKMIDKKMEEEDNEVFEMMEKVSLEVTTRSSLSDVYESLSEEGHRILILFYPDETLKTTNVGKDGIKKFLNLMRLLYCREGVIISEKKLASSAEKDFERCVIETSLTTDIYNVIFYNDGDFVNIIDHISAPKVLRVLRTEEEINTFSLENRIDIKKIPVIESTDAMVKFYRAKIGNIFELERQVLLDNMIQDKEMSYRIVNPPTELKK
jgi:DNA-directed RNA polymerase subunit H (RpoH/RPB5)